MRLFNSGSNELNPKIEKIITKTLFRFTKELKGLYWSTVSWKQCEAKRQFEEKKDKGWTEESEVMIEVDKIVASQQSSPFPTKHPLLPCSPWVRGVLVPSFGQLLA